MSNPECIVTWKDGEAEGSKLLEGYLQMSIDQIVTIFESSALVAYLFVLY